MPPKTISPSWSKSIKRSNCFSLIIFLIAASTDWLDGYLARKLNQITELGKFLDPLVDKLLVLAPLLALIEMDLIAAWGVVFKSAYLVGVVGLDMKL